MKKLHAQQITEFMLAAPLLILFFAILTEFAFAFNANLVLNNAVKSSISAYLSTVSEDAKKNDYENSIKNYIQSDFQKNQISNISSLNINLITIDEHPAVIADYTYTPGFGLAFLPALRKIKMNTISVFPFKNLDLSGYENGISTEELNELQQLPPPDEELGEDSELEEITEEEL